MYIYDYQNLKTEVLLSWFIGATGGGLFGAFLNSSYSKILIYVSITNYITPKCSLNVHTHFHFSLWGYSSTR